MNDETHAHQEVWSLLPWLVNDKASADQRRRAEAHLLVCADCRAELAREQSLARALAAPPSTGPDVEQGLQRLMQRLDQPDERVAPPSRWRQLAGTRLGLGSVAALGAAELLLLGALGLWWLQGWTPAGGDAAPYQVLTRAAPTPTDVQRWRVVFEERHTLHELQALLRSNGLSIVAGPSDAGVFTLAAAAAPRDAGSADALAARLRASPLVRFAEALPPPGRP